MMKSNITKISLKPRDEISIHSKKAIELFCKRHKLAPMRSEIPFSLAGDELNRKSWSQRYQVTNEVA